MIDTTSRRAMLAGFAGTLAVPAIATVPMREPSPHPLDAIRHQADLLAGMMQELHGGTWHATVDHDSGFVTVRTKPTEQSADDMRELMELAAYALHRFYGGGQT